MTEKRIPPVDPPTAHMWGVGGAGPGMPLADYKRAMEQMAVPAPYGDVVAERQRQDAKWGGPDHDDTHQPWEWMGYIAVRAYTPPRTEAEGDYRQRLVEIAALAVAAIESLDRKLGGQPDA